VIPLLVDLETAWRGGQNQFFLLLKGLHQRGHAAELLTAHGSALGERAAKAGFCVHRVSRGLLRLPTAFAIRSLLAEQRFDLIHVNESHALTAAWMARLGGQARANYRMPMIVSRRVGYPIGKSRMARARFLAASEIIANCNWVAEQAVASGAPQEKVNVVYEGVEIPEMPTAEQREKARARWGISSEQILLGCVGVLLPDKGQEWLIRALAELRSDFSSCRLLLAGDGPCRKDLETLARSLGIADAVILAGFVEDVESVYAALDVFLLPSLFEALNNSLLAAMAHGIPSVAFRQGGQAEIIEDGISGLLVAPRKREELTTAIRKILCEPSFAAEVARAGRRRIETQFSAEAMVEGTIRIYQKALSGSN
jgi:glycosyltransferase involved in cell wall biosynthesis